MPDARAEHALAAHDLLLTLAGSLPDASIAAARQLLAAGDLAAMAEGIAVSVLATGVALAVEDADLLAELAGGRAPDLSSVAVAGYDPDGHTRFTFEPAPGDALDHVAAELVTGLPAARGLWSAVRSGWDGAAACRVFVVELDAGSDPIGATSMLQSGLELAGDNAPQVEAYEVNVVPPVYQRMARSAGTLTWARDPAPEITVAVLYDEVDPQRGPSFRPDHPVVEDEPERGRVLDYLYGGEALLVSTARMPDVVDAKPAPVVPANFRTDGTWIWSDASAYYLSRYGLAPDPALLAHIRAQAYELHVVDGVALHRALAVLREPGEQPAVWTFR